MRLLVTGGLGFIGSHFVRQMLGLSHVEDLMILDNETYASDRTRLEDLWDDPRLNLISGDICAWDDVDDAMQSADIVVHFAAESHVDRSIGWAHEFIETNVLGTQMLVDAALRHGVKRFVHVSTDEVYGSISHGSWTEDSPLAPRSPYAASKAASDMVVMAAHHTHGLDVVITRGSNTYGPYQHPEKVIPHFTTQLLTGGCAPLYGDGLNVREWLHVDDHAAGILAALSHGKSGQVYHLGGEPMNNRELTQIILDTLEMDWNAVCPVEDRKGHDRRYSLDITRTRLELGFMPHHGAEAGIPDTVRWYRDHSAWWKPLVDKESA